MDLRDTSFWENWLLARISTVQIAHNCQKILEKITKFFINYTWYKLLSPSFKSVYLRPRINCIVQHMNFENISYTFGHKINILPDAASYPHVWGVRLGFLDLLCIRSHVLDRPDNLALILYLSPQIAVWPKHSISGLSYLIHSFRYSSHYASGEILPNVFRLKLVSWIRWGIFTSCLGLHVGVWMNIIIKSWWEFYVIAVLLGAFISESSLFEFYLDSWRQTSVERRHGCRMRVVQVLNQSCKSVRIHRTLYFFWKVTSKRWNCSNLDSHSKDGSSSNRLCRSKSPNSTWGDYAQFFGLMTMKSISATLWPPSYHRGKQFILLTYGWNPFVVLFNFLPWRRVLVLTMGPRCFKESYELSGATFPSWTSKTRQRGRCGGKAGGIRRGDGWGGW